MNSKLLTLTDGFTDAVKDIYNAEQQLLKALPKMEKKATSPKLKEAFRAHKIETESHVERLEKIGLMLEEKLTGKTCKAMQGLIEEGSEVIEETSENKALLDVMLIGAAQRVEHYEMAAYTAAHAMAVELGKTEMAKLLEATLKEEQEASRKLTTIAEGDVLSQASTFMVANSDKKEAKPIPTPKSQGHKTSSGAARLASLAACLAFAHQVGPIAFAETTATKAKNESEATGYLSNNTGRNVRDRNEARLTADDQKMGGSEIEVLARIRREIVANDSLSTNAHNVKIIVENGKVVLRGPVKSAQEMAWIRQATARTATGFTVVNQLEIGPS
jgi:ferritin-like metal-binding protein YciE/osmotically-inducible protein OsmY